MSILSGCRRSSEPRPPSGGTRASCAAGPGRREPDGRTSSRSRTGRAPREDLADEPLALRRPVDVGGVEERDPTSRAASTTGRLSSSPIREPKLFAPRPRTEISGPSVPSPRFSTPPAYMCFSGRGLATPRRRTVSPVSARDQGERVVPPSSRTGPNGSVTSGRSALAMATSATPSCATGPSGSR